jgi:hypothetical protein
VWSFPSSGLTHRSILGWITCAASDRVHRGYSRLRVTGRANVWSGVTFDCLDPQRVARFRGARLGREPRPSRGGRVHLGQRGGAQPRLVPARPGAEGRARPGSTWTRPSRTSARAWSADPAATANSRAMSVHNHGPGAHSCHAARNRQEGTCQVMPRPCWCAMGGRGRVCTLAEAGRTGNLVT